MLLVSKIIENAREIKSKIGDKSYDTKVLDYYTKLTKGLDTYSKTDSISDKIKKEIEKWSSILDKQTLSDLDNSLLKKLGLPNISNPNGFGECMGDLLVYDESELRAECVQRNIEFESTCFPRAMLFYISVLDFNDKYPWVNEEKEMKIKTIPANLNFYKEYIKKIASLDFDEMCRRYAKIINNHGKESYIKSEIAEYSKVLTTHKSKEDWKYIEEDFQWSIMGIRPEGFDNDTIHYKLNMLSEGKFYQIIIGQDIGVDFMIRLLTIEMYIEFLNNQLPKKPATETPTTNSLPVESTPKLKTQISAPQIGTFKFKSSKYKATKDAQAGLTDLFNSLKKNNFVDPNSLLANFRSIFSGEIKSNNTESKITWIGTNAELHYFIDLIFSSMENSEDDIWKVTSNCFKPKNKVGYELESLRKAKVEEVKDGKKEQLDKCANHILSNL